MGDNTKNLGQVAGLHIGQTAPSNATLIWYDNTPAIMCHKVYDTVLMLWVSIDQKIVAAITYNELVVAAQTNGLSVGKFYNITDIGNTLAVAITTTKVQYADIKDNLVIDDLGANLKYYVASSNLTIDGNKGTFNVETHELGFAFDEYIPSIADDYLFGKVKSESTFKFAKYKISSLLSTFSNNAISWDGGFYFNFKNAIAGILDKVGGVVSFNSFNQNNESINIAIGNVGKDNQGIKDYAKGLVDNAVTAIPNTKINELDVSGVTIDPAGSDSLFTVLSKIQKYINKFKFATGIKLSQGFKAAEERNFDNLDTVESALAKIKFALSNTTADTMTLGVDTSVLDVSGKLTPMTKDKSILEALSYLISKAAHSFNYGAPTDPYDASIVEPGIYIGPITGQLYTDFPEETGLGYYVMKLPRIAAGAVNYDADIAFSNSGNIYRKLHQSSHWTALYKTPKNFFGTCSSATPLWGGSSFSATQIGPKHILVRFRGNVDLTSKPNTTFTWNFTIDFPSLKNNFNMLDVGNGNVVQDMPVKMKYPMIISDGGMNNPDILTYSVGATYWVSGGIFNVTLSISRLTTNPQGLFNVMGECIVELN